MNDLSIKSGCLLLAASLTSAIVDPPILQHKPNLAIAQPAKTSTKPAPASRRRSFPIPEGAAKNGYYGRNVGAGSRGDETECSQPRNYLTAIVPAYQIDPNKPTSTSVFGFTASKNPTLWFYNPYQGDEVVSASLKLSTRDNNQRTESERQQAIKLSQPAGFISIELPKNIPLAIDRPYKWELELTLKCPENHKVFVSGWIVRKNINPALKQKLTAAAAKERASLYADNNFWYEGLNILAQLRRDRPQDPAISKEWKELLSTDSNLVKLAEESLPQVTRSSKSTGF